MINAHISFSIEKECINLADSYGMICVRCNACGRWNEETMLVNRLKLYQRQLQEEYDFDGWDEDEGVRKLQRANIDSNIEYYKQKIRETEELVKVN